MIITYPSIFTFYWLLYVTWSKSPDSSNAITHACVDICPLIVSVEEKQSAQEFQLFFSSVNMEGNQTSFNESRTATLKSWWQLHSPSDHHWLFYHVYARLHCEKNYREGYKINKPLFGLLVYRLIMSLAERLSSKFHICPRSLASRPNVHFSDNISAADTISRYTSRRKGFIY